jgi:sulfite dehydrogenase (quinone) subunit SoeA
VVKGSRRTFLKGSAAVGGGLLASRLATGPLETLLAASPKAATAKEEWLPTTCWIGKQDCGILARAINGRVVKLEGNPAHPRNQGTLCPKGAGQIMALYDYNRLGAPLVRTNGKGVPGEWRRVSWDQALDLLAEKINEAREQAAATNPANSLIAWQVGRSHSSAVQNTAFAATIGADVYTHSALCGDAGRRADDITVGSYDSLHADFRHTRYLLNWGWNLTEAGGNVMCWLAWNQQLLDARERGMKIVHIDPRLRSAGPFADEWLPIKPGTDMALALALCHEIIAQGTIDREYLVHHTNAAFLVQDDGALLRLDGKEQVWDSHSGGPRPFDAAEIAPALEGAFVFQGRSFKPAFQLFKDHVAQFTPGWAAQVCGLSADDIRHVARDLGQYAMIGSTTVIDGVPLPYRPVAVAGYHAFQQELGTQSARAIIMVFMLLGAIEAVGGPRFSLTWGVHANHRYWDTAAVKDPPYNIWLKDSKFFPGVNSKAPTMIFKVMADPARYGVEEKSVPRVYIIQKANPAASYPDTRVVGEALKKMFVAVVDPFLSKTADLYGDVVLPAATMEKYDGPVSASNQYMGGTAIRVPVTQPLFQSKSETEIYLDLCEKLGLLHGENGYLDRINRALALSEMPLPLDTKPSVEEIYDRWASEKMEKAPGLVPGAARKQLWLTGPVKATSFYGSAANPPFGGIRGRLYAEPLVRLREQMKAKGAEEVYWRDFTPFPTWRSPTMEASPREYDLVLISPKKIEFKQSRGSYVPLLAELAPEQRLAMNPAAARKRFIKDGDEVWVESHNAITGEKRKVKTNVELTEGIRPDVVAMPHHYGEIARHPWVEGQGPTPNDLFFTGEGYVDMTQNQSFLVRVRVFRA